MLWSASLRYAAGVQLSLMGSLFVFQEPSLFAVAKLLETGLVNMDRIEILWRPLTGHLLEVTATRGLPHGAAVHSNSGKMRGAVL